MKTFLIILAVLIVIIAIILSLSATITIIYDEKWTTKIKVLWIEKDIKITEILNFILFPEKKAQEVKEEKSVKKEKKKKSKEASKKDKNVKEPVLEKATETVCETKLEDKVETVTITETVTKTESSNDTETVVEETKTVEENKSAKKSKPNYIKSLWDKEGVVGIMDLASNLMQTVSSAVGTLFRGFHIYSLYVKIIVGGYDAAEVALAYGTVCKYYYPIKGIILNGMKVDNYDDMIMPDYIAPENEYGLQFIGSISVGTLLKVVLAAAKTFVVNIIKK